MKRVLFSLLSCLILHGCCLNTDCGNTFLFFEFSIEDEKGNDYFFGPTPTASLNDFTLSTVISGNEIVVPVIIAFVDNDTLFNFSGIVGNELLLKIGDDVDTLAFEGTKIDSRCCGSSISVERARYRDQSFELNNGIGKFALRKRF